MTPAADIRATEPAACATASVAAVACVLMLVGACVAQAAHAEAKVCFASVDAFASVCDSLTPLGGEFTYHNPRLNTLTAIFCTAAFLMLVVAASICWKIISCGSGAPHAPGRGRPDITYARLSGLE
jgi:hypothetical protein